MRIGYLSCFTHNWNTESEIADYLEMAGHRVDRVQYDRFDKRRFLSQGYDIVLTALPQCQDEDFWKQVEAKKVAWYFDLIFGWRGREKQYIPALKNFDLLLSTDGYEDKYAEHGIKRIWMPHGFDPRKYQPIGVSRQFDVGFIGHIYTPRRKKLIDTLSKYFDFQLFGLNDNCWGKKYAQICNMAKVIVCDNAVNDLPGYWSDRLYLSTGSGAFVLHPDVPGVETQFTPGKHFDLWHDEAELHDKIRYYLKYDDERIRMAEAGCAHAHEHHTTGHRVKEFGGLIEDWPCRVQQPGIERRVSSQTEIPRMRLSDFRGL